MSAHGKGRKAIRFMCGGKMYYATKRDAQTMANHRTTGRQHRRRRRPENLRAYECPHCGGWHLTHHEQRDE